MALYFMLIGSYFFWSQSGLCVGYYHGSQRIETEGHTLELGLESRCSQSDLDRGQFSSPLGSHSFCAAVPTIWISLPDSFYSSDTFNSF